MDTKQTPSDAFSKGSYTPQNLSLAYDEFIKSVCQASKKLVTSLETPFNASFGENVGSQFCLDVEDISQKYVDDIDRLLKTYIGKADQPVSTSGVDEENNLSIQNTSPLHDGTMYVEFLQKPVSHEQTDTATPDQIVNATQEPITAKIIEKTYNESIVQGSEVFVTESDHVPDETQTYYLYDGQTFQVSNGEIIFDEQGDLQHDNIQYVTTSFPEGTVVVKCEDMEADFVESAIASETIICDAPPLKEATSTIASNSVLKLPPVISAKNVQPKLTEITRTKDVLIEQNVDGKTQTRFWDEDGRKTGIKYFSNVNADKEDVDFEYSITPISRKKPKRKALLPGAKPGLPCDVCGDVLASKMALTRHVNQVHPNIGKWKCLVCCKILPAWKKLRTHFRIKHMVGGKGFKCPECETVFRGHRKFKDHLTECTYKCPDGSIEQPIKEEKPDIGSVEPGMNLPFKCAFCPRSFKTNGNLNNHLTKSHLKYTPGSTNSCDLCEKRYTKPYYYARHCETASHRRRVREKYGIPDDEDTFSAAAAKFSKTKRSRKRYGGDKSKDDTEKELNICHICGRSGFTTKSNLYIHIRTHTKPFHCDMCDKRFSEKMHLRAHRRLHTGEVPFVCELCGKFFREKYLLNHHKSAIHSGRAFKCNDCQTMFKYKRSLCMHMKKKHGIEDFEIVYHTLEEAQDIEFDGFY